MRNILINLLLVCACISTHAQTNFVKNPGFEEYSICPNAGNQIRYASYWSDPIDSTFKYGAEYLNTCSNILPDISLHVPNGGYFYQFPHSKNGMALGNFYYNKTLPPPPSPLPFNYRDYLQGRLIKKLTAGREYCISFWINYVECSGIAHNKMGAYLDDGSINSISLPAGSEINTVVPQIFTNDIISDTLNWRKIEATFISFGNESFITIGLFIPNADVSSILTNYCSTTTQYSAYLIDDVSVIPIDLAADAGKDSHAELGKKVQIGRVGDTTAEGLDCKWYRKGLLIDSGAIISVNAGATVGAIDTYVVVQTICGLVKTDTVTVKTVPVGIPLLGGVRGGFSVYPNPSNGSLTITPHAVIPTKEGSLHAKVYDFLGRVVYQKELSFSNNEASINLNAADGVYILELSDSEGNSSRQRIEIRN